MDTKARKTKWRLESLKQEGRRNQDKKGGGGRESMCYKVRLFSKRIMA